jgi:hypothetical protein
MACGPDRVPPGPCPITGETDPQSACRGADAMKRGRCPFGDAAALRLALAAALLVAGCGAQPAPSPSPNSSLSPSPSPATHHLSADVILHVPGLVDFSDPTDCAGFYLLADIHSSVDVIVTDAAGVTVGTATLSKGVAVDDPRSCRFTFRLDGLSESPSYSVRIGQRGFGSITFEDLVSGNIAFLIPWTPSCTGRRLGPVSRVHRLRASATIPPSEGRRRRDPRGGRRAVRLSPGPREGPTLVVASAPR